MNSLAVRPMSPAACGAAVGLFFAFAGAFWTFVGLSGSGWCERFRAGFTIGRFNSSRGPWRPAGRLPFLLLGGIWIVFGLFLVVMAVFRASKRMNVNYGAAANT